MNLFAQYYREREGVDTLETEHGFVTYKLRPTDCYIIDIYVVPEKRQSGIAAQMADRVAEIAKKHGLKILTGSVDDRDPQAKRNEKILTAYGMRNAYHEEHMTYYAKEIT